MNFFDKLLKGGGSLEPISADALGAGSTVVGAMPETLPVKIGETITYEEAFKRVIGHEGGFTDDRRDRGNWTSGVIGKGELKGTKFGITAMAYPNLDIKNLTVADAERIYKVDYWDRARCDEFDGALAFQIFDAAVNHGIGNAIRFLQRALDVADDGSVGNITMGAYMAKPIPETIVLYIAERGEFYTKLSTFNTYGKGWINRLMTNLRFIVKDLKGWVKWLK